MLALLGFGFFAESNVVHAGSNQWKSDLRSNETLTTYPLLLDDGDTLNFFTAEDREAYVQYYKSQNSGIQTFSAGNKTREKFISSKTFYSKFIGYNPLTPSWSYASRYTISRGKSLSFSTGYTYDGVSATLSVSNSYGVSVTLPANSKKASRLAAKADVKVSKYKMELYNGITVLQTFYVLRTSSVKNITNYVKYR
nr:hypothetical protein BAU18_05955 [Enterococcus diestrammenae]